MRRRISCTYHIGSKIDSVGWLNVAVRRRVCVQLIDELLELSDIAHDTAGQAQDRVRQVTHRTIDLFETRPFLQCLLRFRVEMVEIVLLNV